MLIQAAQRMICHHCCCYSPWAFDLGLQRTDQSHGGLFLHSIFFRPFFTFFPPFFLLFLSYINTSSLLIFNLLIGGKLQLFFSIFGPDLVRLSGAITQESCSLSNPLLLMISTLTPQVPVAPWLPFSHQGTLTSHRPASSWTRIKTFGFLHTLFNSNLSFNLRNSNSRAFYQYLMYPLTLLLVPLFVASQIPTQDQIVFFCLVQSCCLHANLCYYHYHRICKCHVIVDVVVSCVCRYCMFLFLL